MRILARQYFLTYFALIFSICFSAHAFPAAKIDFTPPPIPEVNTPEFKEFVRRYHTFPSPFSFEPYRDQQGKEIKFLLSELNSKNPYIPVTFYCNVRNACPMAISITPYLITFHYPYQVGNLTLSIQGENFNNAIVGYYFAGDPVFYPRATFYGFDTNTRAGDRLVTMLFSQKVLQNMSQQHDNKFRGFFSANDQAINLPSANGNEFLEIGTSLSLIGLGEASGVEFSETVSQTTGESHTKQVQTGFSLNIGYENQFTLGGGVLPIADSVKLSINATLSRLVTNGIEISNQKTVSRTYTIKPGINDNYYWGIYQLMYSYHTEAKELDAVFTEAQKLWQDKVSFRIADNKVSRDGKAIGNLLPPQAPNVMNDITVGVAVPINGSKSSKQNLFSSVLK